MAETIQTKTCSKCKQIKPLTEFYTRKASKDGKTYSCKMCINIINDRYKKTEKGREISRRCCHRYQQTEDGKKAIRRYGRSQKGLQRKYRFPEHYRARNKVNNAIQNGFLPSAKTHSCQCGQPAHEYHHHHGYKPEHWLDVIPVCIICHKSIHNKS